LSSFRLRDRDAIISNEGIIFRVYGYSHPQGAYICDPEYAPAGIYKSRNSRSYRVRDNLTYCKFFSDEGLRCMQKKYPQYKIWYAPLQRSLVGVKGEQIVATAHPDTVFQSLLEKRRPDSLILAFQSLMSTLLPRSGLSRTDFGVFGSLLHNFYNPNFSDIDLIVYGRSELKRLRETLGSFYGERGSLLRNEFRSINSVREKHWKFQNFSLKEYVSHQRRKEIYALFCDKERGRTIKVEFEPAKRWEEIQNEYNENTRIERKGWVRLLARVTDDSDAAFIPSTYQIVPVKILEGKHADSVQRVVSFVEEFRMQASTDELIMVEGNLEQVIEPTRTLYQTTLTYCPRYYEQVLKVAS
jgi:predicted nucleotidyltransferase